MTANSGIRASSFVAVTEQKSGERDLLRARSFGPLGKVVDLALERVRDADAEEIHEMVPYSGPISESGHEVAYRCSTEGFVSSQISRFESRSGACVQKQPTTLSVAPYGYGWLDAPRAELDDLARSKRTRSMGDLFGYHRTRGTEANLGVLREALYFAPMLLGDRLRRAGEFVAALDWYRTVYDYERPVGERRLYPGLVGSTVPGGEFGRGDDWLRDPLDPHGIAAVRPAAYARYTVTSVVRCLLGFADDAFGRGDAESINRARRLYETALSLFDEEPELLSSVEPLCGFEALRRDLEETGALAHPLDDSMLSYALQRWHRLESLSTRTSTRDEMVGEMVDGVGQPLFSGVFEAMDTIEAAAQAQSAEELGTKKSADDSERSLFRQDVPTEEILRALRAHQRAAMRQAEHGIEKIVGDDVEDHESFAWLSNPDSGVPMSEDGILATGDAELFDTDARRPTGRDLQDLVDPVFVDGLLGFRPRPRPTFCTPPDPGSEVLRLRAETHLAKIASCLDISGRRVPNDRRRISSDSAIVMPSFGSSTTLEIPGAGAISPTEYRYSYLIRRAREQAQWAAQIEGQLLSALEKRDAEAYGLLLAEQGLEVTEAQVDLREIAAEEALQEIRLGELQRERAQLQRDRYDSWIELGVLEEENRAWSYLLSSEAALEAAIYTQKIGGIASTIAAFLAHPTQAIGVATNSLVSYFSLNSQLASARASRLQTRASYRLRERQWELQRDLSAKDVAIAEQQRRVARGRVRLAREERHIAELGAEHAEQKVRFLEGKFSNFELYDWMGEVLEDVYARLLHIATATAKLAERQLAFERQEPRSGIIDSDYREPPSRRGSTGGAGVGGEQGVDRRGLTGSARLMLDIERLEEHARSSDERRLQLQKTFSLAELAPGELQRLRDEGALSFSTNCGDFDRDHPGHCLRLIHDVQVSVLALVPPVRGLQGRLISGGVSKTTRPSGSFAKIEVRRTPQQIALSSATGRANLFRLDPQGELLRPFEGMGVETQFTLELPKAANAMDYDSIADVLLTVEYTAVARGDKYDHTVRSLPSEVERERSLPFAREFLDAWYAFEQTPADQALSLQAALDAEDFLPQTGPPRLAHAMLYVLPDDGAAAPSGVTVRLAFTPEGASTPAFDLSTTIEDGIASSRRPSSFGDLGVVDQSPFGTWTITFPGSDSAGHTLRQMLDDGALEDVVLVLEYSADLPAWDTP